jgi:hypothetical protein
MSTNILSVEITQEKDTAVNQLLGNFQAEMDWLVDLSVKGRRELSKMGRRNLDMVERSYQHAGHKPKYLTLALPIEEFKKDVELYRWLRKLEKKLDLLSDKIKDTAMLAEAEAYQAARVILQLCQSGV